MRGRCQYSHRSEAMSREPPHAAARRRMQRPRRRLRDDRLGRPLSPSRVISGVSRQRISGPCDQHRPTLTTTLRVDVTRLGTRQGGLDEDRSSVPGVRLSLFVSWYSSLGVRLKREPAAAPPVGRFPLCAWACEEGGVHRVRCPRRAALGSLYLPRRDASGKILRAADRDLTGRLWHPSARPSEQHYSGRRRVLFALETDIHAGLPEARRVPGYPPRHPRRHGMLAEARRVRLPAPTHNDRTHTDGQPLPRIVEQAAAESPQQTLGAG
jgi:hypothetical protein